MTSADAPIVHETLFIGGEWVASASDATIEVVSPITEEVIGRVPDAGPADVDRAVDAARYAFESGPWPRTDPEERAEAIAALSEALRARGPELADTITSENGCPAQQSLMAQVLAAVAVLDTYADLTRGYPWVDERTGALGNPVRVLRVPAGVCAGVIPWNVPLFIAAMKLGPALAAGCTVVLKPAPETPLDAYLLAQAVEESGLPPGVVNIVPATHDASEYLVAHPEVDKVSFTGSTATGSRVGAICGEQIKRLTLELGGKSAAIVLDDVDLESSLAELLMSGLLNNGQICGAQSRILAPRSRYDEIVDAVAAGVSAMRVGDPRDADTAIGPMVARRQQQRVQAYLEAGRAEGATVACGGNGRPAHLERGWYVDPTVFADVDNSMTIAREEIFGPVLAIIPYATEEEAVAIANDSPYGLCGSVWTSDPEHGAEVATQVRTGCVAINSSMILDLRSPFGGFKKSGIGRELGSEGIDPYTECQSIILPTG